MNDKYRRPIMPPKILRPPQLNLMNDNYKGFFLPLAQTNNPWLDFPTKELFQNPVMIEDITQYFGDDKMLMKDLMLSIKHTIENSHYTKMSDCDCEPQIYFHKTDTSTLYNYIYDQFHIEDEHDMERVIITYSYGFLDISIDYVLDVKSIPEMDFKANIEQSHLNRIGLSINMTNEEEEIKELLKENEPSPFIVANKTEYINFFADGRIVNLFNITKYNINESEEVVLYLETNLNPKSYHTYTYSYGSEEQGYKIESVTTLNEKSEINKVTIFDFNKQCNISYSKLENKENVVLLFFIFGEYYGFIINPNNENQNYSWIKPKRSLGHNNKPKEEK